MSTKAVTERWPQRARRSIIHGGVAARVFTFRTMRPENRPHRSGASIVTGSAAAWVTRTGGNVGCASGEPVNADNSRAMP